MKSFLQQSKKNDKQVFTHTFFVVLVVVVILALVHIFFPHSLAGTLQRAVAPLWSNQNAIVVYVQEKVTLLRSKRSLVRENRSLEEALTGLNSELLLQESLLEENRVLKELLGRDVDEESIVAAVLAHPNVSPYDTLVIDIGTNAGVQKGNLVIAQGTIAIGEVASSFKTTALVRLFSAPGVETPIRIGQEAILVTAVGQGGGTFSADIPREVPAQKGDIVTLPSISPMVFAIVEEIIVRPADPFKRIFFKNPINMSELSWVQVTNKRTLPDFSLFEATTTPEVVEKETP